MTTDASNGNGQQHESVSVDNVALAARIEVAIAEARAARKASEDNSVQIHTLKRLVTSVANDLFEQRTGIPSSWNRRLVLVGLASLVAACVSGCMQYVFHR